MGVLPLFIAWNMVFLRAFHFVSALEASGSLQYQISLGCWQHLHIANLASFLQVCSYLWHTIHLASALDNFCISLMETIFCRNHSSCLKLIQTLLQSSHLRVLYLWSMYQSKIFLCNTFDTSSIFHSVSNVPSSLSIKLIIIYKTERLYSALVVILFHIKYSR